MTRSRFVCSALLGPLLALSPLRAAHADTISYCDFSSVSNVVMNGSANSLGTTLELTDPDVHLSASAYDMTPLVWDTTTSFHTSFAVVMQSPGGAEGIAFILQGEGPFALGGNTGEMGYGNITSSIEVEFDTYQDEWDPNDNHVAIMENGDYRTHLATATPSFALAGAAEVFGWIDYDAPSTTLDVYVSESGSKPAAPLVTLVIDVAAALGSTALAGFTAATGGGANVNEQDVLSWELSTDGTPCVCGGDADCTTPGTTCDDESGVCTKDVAPVDAGVDHPGDAGADAPAPTGCTTTPDCDEDPNTKTPVCGPSGTCEACATNADCVAPLLPYCQLAGPHAGQCVGCTSSAECRAADAGEEDAETHDAEANAREDEDAGSVPLSCIDDGVTNACGVAVSVPDAGAHPDAGARPDASLGRDAAPDAPRPHDAARAKPDSSQGESFAGGACSCRAAGADGADATFGEALFLFGALLLRARKKQTGCVAGS